MNQEEANQAKAPPDNFSAEENFNIEIFSKEKNVNISGFSCGVDTLDKYARNQLSQDVKKRVAVCYFLQKDNNLLAFYTLSSASVDAEQYLTIKKGVGRYLPVPVTLIGRLAVDTSMQGQNLGGALLLDAIKKAIDSSENVASKAIIVDAIDENVVNFYKKFGFMLIPGTLKMLITMEEAEGLVNAK